MQWKRTIGWIFLGLILLVIIAVAGGYLYLRSSGFQQFALRKISEQADQATGGRTQISRLDFSLSKLTAHLYGIVVHGSEPAGAPPLLQVDELTVGLKIKSVFRRQINLDEIVIRHPAVHLQVDRPRQKQHPAISAKPITATRIIFSTSPLATWGSRTEKSTITTKRLP